MKLSKVRVLFKKRVLKNIKKIEGGRPDYPLRKEAWASFIDELQRMGELSMLQYETADYPRECLGS